MDGVFMKKFAKFVSTLLLVVVAFYLGSVSSDKRLLSENLIRLHVVADSNSAEDQAIKLQVRDAITAKLETVMEDFPDLETAKAYLQAHLPELEKIANDTLAAAGNSCQAVVTLAKEAFPTREYDTFTLPAGIYESLRVTIGSGEGKNWWCVVFPSLCVGATVEEFSETALCAGMPEGLAGALAGEEEYEVRFFLLDALGKFENFLHKG